MINFKKLLEIIKNHFLSSARFRSAFQPPIEDYLWEQLGKNGISIVPGHWPELKTKSGKGGIK